jgi:hypothetical protein
MKLSRRDFNNVKKSWLTYVQSEREKQTEDSYVRLGSGRCCGKSQSSYPHWPPTGQQEALDQLQCLLGRSYPHRDYLAECWLSNLFGQLLPVEGRGPGSKTAGDLKRTISLIQKSCPALLRLDRQIADEATKPKRRRMDCEGICEPVLVENRSDCLCCCPFHREECPAHGTPGAWRRLPMYL